jgi:peptidoglycan L-alanyl-D-glutamate endopeptidase CwlK
MKRLSDIIARLVPGRPAAPPAPPVPAAGAIPVSAVGDPPPKPAPAPVAAPVPHPRGTLGPLVDALAAETAGLTPRDRERLAGVHPDLVRVVIRARVVASFLVVEGVRSPERQAQLYAEGKSRTMQSRHLTGHAVDLVPWDDRDGNRVAAPAEIDWSDKPAFARLAEVMRRAAEAEGVPLRWGGEFKGFYDGPHFELPRDRYPA